MTETTSFAGRCHCGNLGVIFESRRRPGELFVRSCACSFCRRHAGRYVSDPEGGVRITVRDPAKLTRYRFGHKTADFLVCGNCGVFLGAVMTEDASSYAVINVNTFDQAEAFGTGPAAFDYDSEDEADRLTRRKARWTPVLGFVEGTE